MGWEIVSSWRNTNITRIYITTTRMRRIGINSRKKKIKIKMGTNKRRKRGSKILKMTIKFKKLNTEAISIMNIWMIAKFCSRISPKFTIQLRNWWIQVEDPFKCRNLTDQTLSNLKIMKRRCNLIMLRILRKPRNWLRS